MIEPGEESYDQSLTIQIKERERWGKGERERERKRDRQADRQTERQ